MCKYITHVDVVLLFRRERVRTVSPIADLVSRTRRSLFLLLCIRDRENGSARVFIAGKLCRSYVCRCCKLSDGNARVLEGTQGAFRFSEKGKEHCWTSLGRPTSFPRFLPPFGPYASDLPLSLLLIS